MSLEQDPDSTTKQEHREGLVLLPFDFGQEALLILAFSTSTEFRRNAAASLGLPPGSENCLQPDDEALQNNIRAAYGLRPVHKKNPNNPPLLSRLASSIRNSVSRLFG